jgi:hypothetical protein
VDERIVDNLLFCDFADPKSEAKNYIEVQDMEHLKTVVDGYMEEYNNTSKRPLHLYMFRCGVFYAQLLASRSETEIIETLVHLLDYELNHQMKSKTKSQNDHIL